MGFFQLSAQAKPFVGYGKVAWGATENKVRISYGISKDIPLVIDSKDPNVATLTQVGVSQQIESREFDFNKWHAKGFQLYRVIVKYSEKVNTDTFYEAMGRVLTKTYGEATDNKIFYQLNSNSSGMENVQSQIFGKFSPAIYVEFRKVQELENNISPYGSSRLMGGAFSYEVWYTWQEYQNSYQQYEDKQAAMKQAEKDSKIQL
jgi:hypothetical protein